ncbi:MAG: hypothetical protein GXN99_02065 [Candidatus Nanohaloarchaeota archaeon]|nr:hypothetical protein [Candidatus Nanohaloarchaeota archaeon]
MMVKGAEDANIAESKAVLVTTISVLINKPKKELEEMLKNSEYVDDFEIEDLDKEDLRKEVFIVLKNPIDLRFVSKVLSEELFK